jgi:hypothetical protein
MKRLIALLLCVALCCLQANAAGWLPLAKSGGGGGGTVTLQDKSTAVVDSTIAASPYTGTANITVTGSLTNPAMTITLVFGATVSAVTAHWDSAGANQALTQIGTAGETTGPTSTYIFGMVGQPTAGNKTLNVTWTGTANELQIFAETWIGVNQTFATAFPSGHVSTTNSAAISGGATATQTITSATNDAVLASFCNDLTWTSIGATSFYLTNGGFVAGGSNHAAGAVSVNLTAVNNGGDHWCGVGIDIVHN